MNVEELEKPMQLLPLENRVEAKDEDGKTIIYTGKFYDLKLDGNLSIRGNVSLEKTEGRTTIKKKIFRRKEPTYVEKEIWKVNTKNSGYASTCLIWRGKIQTDGSDNYRDQLRSKTINEESVDITKKLFNEVFSPMEKKLLEQYQRIKEF